MYQWHPLLHPLHGGLMDKTFRLSAGRSGVRIPGRGKFLLRTKVIDAMINYPLFYFFRGQIARQMCWYTMLANLLTFRLNLFQDGSGLTCSSSFYYIPFSYFTFPGSLSRIYHLDLLRLPRYFDRILIFYVFTFRFFFVWLRFSSCGCSVGIWWPPNAR